MREKKKKELGAESNPGRPKKRLATGKGVEMGISSGKSTQISFSPGEDSQLNNSQKKDGASNTLLNSIEFVLPQLLSDLHALALDPFHVAERNSPSVTMHFFLQFRSLAYQKSLVSSTPSETEDSRGLTPSKPAKFLVRPNDSTKAGRKRLPSDRQEEIAAKRLKKNIQLKSLAAEKKAAQRTLASQQAEGKQTAATQRAEGKQPVGQPPPRKSVKPDSFKKMEPAVRAIEPTMLMLKFPPETSLPSAAQLKARFARFGSIDQSAIRVFWKSSQCRVVFRRKLDAQAALKYALGNKSLFGDVNAEVPLVERQAVAFAHQPPSQSAVQLKSILKRANDDEAALVTGGNGSRGNRVKFVLGGEETNRGEQMMVGIRNNFNNNNASFADGDAPPPTSVAMDLSSKSFQKFFPPSPLPILPLPAQFAKAPLNNSRHHTEIAPRNLHNFNPPSSKCWP
ncbi:F22F7.12 PROTEIN-RELATED [Salix purpurea]|uniref:F22F7.12 PROTEIN-RELATED n=1 Tax=Salix purpurea TaxID=77065 RepID=A0A9Q0W8T3_SALPP|nr:F22F7.12 PROTEIN-RELATED [Salix purpurea]